MKPSKRFMLSGALAMLVQWAPALVAAETETPATGSPESAETKVALLESTCVARSQSTDQAAAPGQLFARLGGEARIHVITREMVRLHLQSPALSGIVGKYNPDYLADILARYLITATGGPTRYEGRPLNETHAHLHLTNAQFLAGGTDFAEAMRNVGATEEETLDTMCLLIGLRSQIVQQ